MSENNRSARENRIKAVQSTEELRKLIQDAGEDITFETANSMFNKIKDNIRRGFSSVSEDEMATVYAGFSPDSHDPCESMSIRYLYVDGCASTASLDDECWGVDGGCDDTNIIYLR